MSKPYSHYAPRTKQAVTVGTALDTLNPTGNQYADYGIYGGAGALGGAGIGALIEMLRDNEEKNYLKSMLIGGGIGGGLGLGAKALGDNYLKDNKAVIDEQLRLMEKGDKAPWYGIFSRGIASDAEISHDYNRKVPLGGKPLDHYDIVTRAYSNWDDFKDLMSRTYLLDSEQERNLDYVMGLGKYKG